MKLTLTFLLTIAFIPGVVLAHDGIDHGPVAQINSETSAESETGGNTGSGSTGNASASSHSTTVIDGSGNGTVEVHVRTETNGVVQEETIKKEVEGAVEVRVSTTSTSKSGAKPAPKTKTEAKAEATVEVKSGGIFSRVASTTFWRNFSLWTSFTGSGTTTVEVEDEGRVLSMIERPQGTTTANGGIRGLFSSIVNIFIFWR